MFKNFVRWEKTEIISKRYVSWLTIYIVHIKVTTYYIYIFDHMIFGEKHCIEVVLGDAFKLTDQIGNSPQPAK
jgi:hypothetical protein